MLWDKEGEFLTVPVAASTTEVTWLNMKVNTPVSEELGDDEPDEMETLCQTVADITTERDTLQVQLQEITQAL